MSKPSEFSLLVSVQNIGRPDGTTRDTWLSVVRLMEDRLNILGSPVAIGDGSGKRPEVAVNRAVVDAFAKRGKGRC